MTASPEPPAQLLALFDALLKQTFGQDPLEDSGVTLPQLALLNQIAAQPGSSLSEIAERMGLALPTVSVGVRRLESAGLVERLPDPADGRAMRLELGTEGQAVQQRAQAFRLRQMRRLLGGLSAAEGQELVRLLTRGVAALEQPR